MKKFLCGALALTMLLGTMTFGVSAAETKTVDFSDYTSNDSNPYIPDGFTEQNYEDKAGGARKMHTRAAGGVYGKEAEDVALKFESIWMAANTNPLTQYYQARYNANVKDGKFLHFSTEMAIKTVNANRWIGFQVGMPDGSTRDINYAVSISREDISKDILVMKFFGAETKFVMPQISWAKFDIIIDSETGLADAYFNGKKAASGVETGIEGFSEFKQAIFAVNQLALANGSYGVSETYIDNVVCEMTDEMPEISKFTPYDTLTFSGYESGLPTNFILNLSNDTFTNLIAADGAFGKSEDDRAFDIKMPEYPNDGTNSPAQWQQVRYKNSAADRVNNCAGAFKISFEMAYTGLSMNRYVEVISKSWSGKKNDHRLFSINNRKLIVGSGNAVDLPEDIVNQRKWMKFDAVISFASGAGSFDLYLNGEKVAENIALTFTRSAPANWESLVNITQIIIGVNHLRTAANDWSAPECNTYFDNVSIKQYGSYPEIDSYTSPDNGVLVDARFYKGTEECENLYVADSVSVKLSKSLNATPILAGYKFNSGSLREVNVGEKGGKEISVNITQGDKVKLFLWDIDNGNIKPIDNAYVISSGAATEQQNQ